MLATVSTEYRRLWLCTV